jgi:hypothetical protein
MLRRRLCSGLGLLSKAQVRTRAHGQAPDAAQDFDLALLGSQDRRLTQQIATLAYQLGYDGIYYQSRHGADLYNWALFEPFELTHTNAAPIRGDDANLLRALALLNLTLNPDL